MKTCKTIRAIHPRKTKRIHAFTAVYAYNNDMHNIIYSARR